MGVRAIEYLYEYPLYRKDLEKVQPEHAAALAVVSYAVNEVNILQKLYLSARHPFCGDDAMDSLVAAFHFVILRTWSAKLFEFSEFLSFGGQKKKTSDECLLSLADAALVDFEPLKTSTGYELARNVRHEASNHYSFDAAKKNLKFLSKSANCKFYIHKEGGNSFFPLGEELMFAARVNRYGDHITSKEERMKLLGEWMDWNLGASRWIDRVHAEFAKKLVFDRFPDKFAQEKMWWLPPEFVGTTTEVTVPIFLRKPR
jgi:hypothetical protein